jgi:menaquinone-dependent protoporphyrinogen oxidase
MKVLVAYASKMGGSKEIAEGIGTALADRGLPVDVSAAENADAPSGYDAVIVGSGLYAGRWRKPARRFVKKNAAALRERPVWFFSSGPLDASAAQHEIPAVKQVAALMDLVHARGHQTFGGRLPADAKGFPASAMAKKNAGDWRDPEQIKAWADGIANTLVMTGDRHI